MNGIPILYGITFEEQSKQHFMGVLLETESAIVEYDPIRKAIKVVWSGTPTNPDEFSIIYNTVLKGFKINFVNTLIHNLEKFSLNSQETYQEFFHRFLPSLAKCGLRKIISVESDEKSWKILEGQIRKLTNMFGKNIEVKIVNSFERAYEVSEY